MFYVLMNNFIYIIFNYFIINFNKYILMLML